MRTILTAPSRNNHTYLLTPSYADILYSSVDCLERLVSEMTKLAVNLCSLTHCTDITVHFYLLAHVYLFPLVLSAGSEGYEFVGSFGTVHVTACVIATHRRQLRPVYQRRLQSRRYGN